MHKQLQVVAKGESVRGLAQPGVPTAQLMVAGQPPQQAQGQVVPCVVLRREQVTPGVVPSQPQPRIEQLQA